MSIRGSWPRGSAELPASPINKVTAGRNSSHFRLQEGVTSMNISCYQLANHCDVCGMHLLHTANLLNKDDLL